jgi:hypothetical protein
MKIVINDQYGGFGLSDEAIREYLRRAYGKDALREEGPDQYGFFHFWVNDEYVHESNIERDDLILIEVIEEMGEKANGRYSNLKIVEIPDDVDWYIEEYDGMEHIAEYHRTWR